jgi:hypothetical protein
MRFRILAAALAATVALGACSSSTSGNPAGRDNAGSQTTASGGGVTTGAVPSSGGNTTASGGGGGGGGIAGGNYCDTIKGAKARLSALGGGDSATFLAEISNAIVVLEQVDASAPSDIKPSWDVVVTKIRAFADAVRKAGITDKQLQDPSTITPQQAQALQAAGAQLDTADFKQATTKIEAEVKATCGVDISG